MRDERGDARLTRAIRLPIQAQFKTQVTIEAIKLTSLSLSINCASSLACVLTSLLSLDRSAIICEMSSRQKKVRKSGGDGSAKVAKLSESLQECYNILKFFQTRPDADAFADPVDWEAFGLMDYPEIITHPMDLSTVQQKLEDGKYSNSGDFAKDMRLIWKNAMTYNRPDSDIFETAEKLAKLFEKKFSKIKSGKKQKMDGDESRSVQDKEVTRNDRLKFSSLVQHLTSEQLGSLVQMIQKECAEAINDVRIIDSQHQLHRITSIHDNDNNVCLNLTLFCIWLVTRVRCRLCLVCCGVGWGGVGLFVRTTRRSWRSRSTTSTQPLCTTSTHTVNSALIRRLAVMVRRPARPAARRRTPW